MFFIHMLQTIRNNLNNMASKNNQYNRESTKIQFLVPTNRSSTQVMPSIIAFRNVQPSDII